MAAWAQGFECRDGRTDIQGDELSRAIESGACWWTGKGFGVVGGGPDALAKGVRTGIIAATAYAGAGWLAAAMAGAAAYGDSEDASKREADRQAIREHFAKLRAEQAQRTEFLAASARGGSVVRPRPAPGRSSASRYQDRAPTTPASSTPFLRWLASVTRKR